MHRLPKRIRRAVAALALAALAPLGAAQAQSGGFPDRPLTLVVGFAPGGSSDTVSRVLAEELGKQLGQRVIVDNRSGASGNIGTQAVLSAPADGHTLLFAAIHLATNPWLVGVKYDTRADLAMVSQITSVPVVMLASGAGALRQPADVVALARQSPGGVRISSGGIGTSSHLAMELFSRSQSVPFVHVPYRGGSPANQALLAGEVDLMFDLMSGSLRQLIDSGRMRALAVMQEQRVASLPEVKSAAELGLPPDTHIRSWQGIAVRAGTPREVVARLHRAVVAAATSPAFAARVREPLDLDVVTSASPEDFQKVYVAELARWGQLIKAANIKPE